VEDQGRTDPDAGHQTQAPEIDALENRAWLKLVNECTDLYDELDTHADGLDAAGREIAEHACLRLQEILQRNGVELIDQDGPFERKLHQLPAGAPTAGAGPPIQVVTPGFRVGRRILRRARVAVDRGPDIPARGDSS
jgi:molecular chaperone GrpE (heat shock protein)